MDVSKEESSAQPQQAISHGDKVTDEFLASVAALLQSDLKVASNDYKLVKKLNDAASEKYENMTQTTKSLSLHVDDLKAKYKSFEPYLAKVEEISAAVDQLEQMVLLLDDYTTRLEAKFGRATEGHDVRKKK